METEGGQVSCGSLFNLLSSTHTCSSGSASYNGVSGTAAHEAEAQAVPWSCGGGSEGAGGENDHS